MNSLHSSLYGLPSSVLTSLESDSWQDHRSETQRYIDFQEASKNQWKRIDGNRNSNSNVVTMSSSGLTPNILGAATDGDFFITPSFRALHATDPIDLSQVMLRNQLRELRRSYALLSDDKLIATTIRDAPALFSLLTMAIKPLHAAFGEAKLLQLEALESDEGTMLRVIVKLLYRAENAVQMMGEFNRNWWIDNCARSKASLAFDYESGDGF